MKFLKWAESIKETLSQEDILYKVEKAEIFHYIKIGLFSIILLSGLMVILLATTGSKTAWLGLATIITSSAGMIITAIEGMLKLERYKAIWDRLEQRQSELREMQAKDL